MLECRICGEKCKSLVTHVSNSSDHPSWNEYKERFPNAQPMSKEHREKLASAARKDKGKFNNEEWLRRKYIEEGKTIKEITKMCEASYDTVRKRFKEFGISIRSKSERRKKFLREHPKANRGKNNPMYGKTGKEHPMFGRTGKENPNYKEGKHNNEEWLRENYIEKEKTLVEVAKECNASRSTVKDRLRRFDIPVRNIGSGRDDWDLELPKRARMFIDGELLGDGSMLVRGKNASFRHGGKYRGYEEWMREKFIEWGLQCSKIYEYEREKSTIYQFETLTYPSMTEFYHRWYPDGEKIVPKDIELSSITVRQWYIGDGQLCRKGDGGIALFTIPFPKEDVEFLIDKLVEKGFKASRWSDNTIYIWKRSKDDFLEYIGSCPEEIKEYYGYKWQEESRTLLNYL